ncbi:MAG: hypothetical protein C0410_09275 [Anaerolinea sp.]|nr:hypothetical protein [Anaerolinea sp.]
MMKIKFRFKQFLGRLAAANPTTKKRGESGQGLVELAVSLIVILVLLAGIVDLSRTIMTKMQLQDAAEEGVVYAMAFPKNCTQIQYRVLQNLSKVKNATLASVVITYTTISTGVSVPCASATGDLKGQLIKVTIANSFPVSMPFLGKVVGTTRTINVEAKGIVIKSN